MPPTDRSDREIAQPIPPKVLKKTPLAMDKLARWHSKVDQYS